MNVKYALGALISIPFLPLMYWQGKKIRASVPMLPEAEGIQGIITLEKEKTLNIITIGESTIAGIGVETHEEGFTGTFAKALAEKSATNIRWKVYARSGYTAKRVKEKLIPKISEQSLDLIVIGLGGNDAFTLNNPKKWRLDVQELIDSIREKFEDTPIVFTNMPPIKEFPAFTSLIKFTVGNLVEILGENLNFVVANNENVYYNAEIITIAEWVKRLNIQAAKATDFFSDGVHPSKFTYQVWARDLSNFIWEKEAIRTRLDTT
ncbi:MAG: SGNH/GDSL hydrolase family protein [Bacteroidota bacterium]